MGISQHTALSALCWNSLKSRQWPFAKSHEHGVQEKKPSPLHKNTYNLKFERTKIIGSALTIDWNVSVIRLSTSAVKLSRQTITNFSKMDTVIKIKARTCKKKLRILTKQFCFEPIKIKWYKKNWLLVYLFSVECRALQINDLSCIKLNGKQIVLDMG